MPSESCAPDRFADEIDESLGQLNPEYRSKRHSGRLGPLRIRPSNKTVADAQQPIPHEQHKHRFLQNEPITTADFRESIP